MVDHLKQFDFKTGNKAAVKLATPELKLEAYLDYCNHVAAGLSKDSWFFTDTNRLLCTWQTMEKYMKEEPGVLDPIHMQMAKCLSKRVWEGKGIQMMGGKIHSEPALYQMFMRNKFGWDKPEQVSRVEENRTDLQSYSQALKEQRESPQEKEPSRND